MKINQLFIMLAVSAIALVIGTGLLSNQQAGSDFSQTPLLQGIDWQAIESIDIESAASTTKVELLSGRWQVTTKGGYDADFSKLAELTQALKGAEIIELKTKQPKNYSRLGLDLPKSEYTVDVKEQSAVGTLLTVKAAGITHEIVVGNVSTNGQGQYVRFTSAPETYLINQILDVASNSRDWVKPEVFAFHYEQLIQVNVDFEQSDDFVIYRPEKEPMVEGTSTSERHTEFQLLSATNDADVLTKTLKYPAVFSGLARNILKVKVMDVFTFNGDVVKNKKKVANFSLSYITNEDKNELLFSLYQDKKLGNNNLETNKQRHFLHINDSKYLLSISEFDFKQISKSFDEYYNETSE